MINRSLIRIKTIQILYSYLLTRSDFKLESAPDVTTATADSKFAYQVYLDFIFLLLKLSGLSLGAGSGTKFDTESALQKNSVGHNLRSNPEIQKAIDNNTKELSKFDEIIPDLIRFIKATDLFAEYKKKKKTELADDVAFWTAIFSTIIFKSKGVERVLRNSSNFSHVGLDNGLKLFINTLTSFDNSLATYIQAKEDLENSLTKGYCLYHALLYLPVLITQDQVEMIEEAKQKHLPTPEERNPNLRFVNNLFVKALKENEDFNAFIEANDDADISMWKDGHVLVSAMRKKIIASELYRNYMSSPAGDFATDAAFWRDVMRTIILPSEQLLEDLERHSILWNDDLNIMGTFVLKTMRRSYADENAAPQIELLPKFLNDEDAKFGARLFDYVVDNREQYRAYIDSFIDTKTWDTERLAFMDIVLMLTAIAEIINFPTIPVPVTCNEYVEIANEYSTARSGQFVNGILSAVVKMLNQEGIINKK